VSRDDPSDLTATLRRAADQEAAGEFAVAATIYEEALAAAPLEPELWFRLGACLRGSGAAEAALQYLEKAAMLAPESVDYALERAMALQDLRRLEEAVAAYNEIRTAHPDNVSAYTNLGVALNEGGHLEDAIGTLEVAREMAPEDPVVLSNYGAALLKAGRVEDALPHLEAATRQDPSAAEAWSNLGFARQETGRLEAALAAHERAVELAPEAAALHWNLAMTLLLTGDYARGFRTFEHRRGMPDRKPRDFDAPEWTGEGPAGLTILVHAEQGIGDAIQFARYLPILAADGEVVHFAAHTAFATLAETLDGVTSVVAGDDPPPGHDYQIPLLSLPHRMGTLLETVPAACPYLRVPEGVVSPFGSGDGRRRVGIVWAGNPNHANDRNRSIDFSRLTPLFAAAGIEWVGLQVGVRAGDAAGTPVVDISRDLTDFARTAAAMAELDLIVSVDTAAAHLAGALGRPVWVLLPHVPDWRWGMTGDATPWYPTARLFRQASPGDWAGVIEAVAAALRSTGKNAC